MKTDINLLLEFLEQAGAEVVGHESPEPESHVAELLGRFSRGECLPEERADICRMLRLHPQWMQWVSTRVKLARELRREESEGAALAG